MVIYSLHKESCVCILEIWQGSENNIDCRDNYWGKKQTKKAPADTHRGGLVWGGGGPQVVTVQCLCKKRSWGVQKG